MDTCNVAVLENIWNEHVPATWRITMHAKYFDPHILFKTIGIKYFYVKKIKNKKAFVLLKPSPSLVAMDQEPWWSWFFRSGYFFFFFFKKFFLYEIILLYYIIFLMIVIFYKVRHFWKKLIKSSC